MVLHAGDYEPRTAARQPVGPDRLTTPAGLSRIEGPGPEPGSSSLTAAAAYSVSQIDPDERVAFHHDFLGPKVRCIPFGRTFIRIVDGVDVNRPPEEAATGRPVFELQQV